MDDEDRAAPSAEDAQGPLAWQRWHPCAALVFLGTIALGALLTAGALLLVVDPLDGALVLLVAAALAVALGQAARAEEDPQAGGAAGRDGRVLVRRPYRPPLTWPAADVAISQDVDGPVVLHAGGRDHALPGAFSLTDLGRVERWVQRHRAEGTLAPGV